MNSYFSTRPLPTRVFRLLIALGSTFLLFQFITIYLGWPKQIIVGSITILIALLLSRRRDSQLVTIALMLLSMAATLRYVWWRGGLIVQFFNDESNNRLTINAVLMLVLISAEAYTILIMVLGYMQTVAPLRRKPIPLPPDESLWPNVDVLIPTYNEPLSLVRYTALAAINMDYPPDKLNVYILDDGSREDFRQFAEEAGVGYVTRVKHDHAKAGNINHALEQMDSPLVTIFDCDHVPTRSFLQVTVGWFLAEKKLAMLQTPHFFYSPDPFERNLLQYKTIPNEGELFYGVIQDGNDLWNATFFCGSCAVIRRTALEEVGGIAVETVTEDAHTSLRMQKKGWNTAYINIPQAAGLATETLSAHVGQRVRWARGMIQIFRTDNPMLASGMKFTQRLCYFNAMLHFMYAVPRLIFLCAPLVYMIFGLTIIPGYWVAILAYALPHLVMSSITNSRVQGNHRHSFWNEIYETVLAPYILMPTLLALINPKLGSFNVTDKGSTLAETRFDRSIAAPTTWLLFFNLIGICMTPYRLSITDPHHPGTVISNLVWICFNMVILGVAGAVANEQKQQRASVRIVAELPITIEFADGSLLAGVTSDLSVGGASLHCEKSGELKPGDAVRIAFPHQTGDAQIKADIVAVRGKEVRLRFNTTTIEDQETLTRAIYSRADSWMGARRNIETDRPLLSLARVIRLSFTGFHQVLYGLFRSKKASSAAIVLFAALALCGGVSAAQIPGAVTATPSAPTAPAPEAIPTAPLAPTPAAIPPEVTAATADDIITLKDMGVQGGVELHGPHSFYSAGFVLPHNLVARHDALEISYRFNPSLLPRAGALKVSINGVKVAEIDAPTHGPTGVQAGFTFISLPLPADFLIRNNQLSFEFTGGTGAQSDAANLPVLAVLGASSRVLVAGAHVPLKTDLGLLPLPLFDSDLQTTTTLPFVFLAPPDARTLQAAGIVASWFGILTSSRPVHFTVSIGSVPPGNAIVFANNNAALLSASLGIPPGASLSLKPNPNDPDGSLLILAGENDYQLLTVARGLALMKTSHTGAGETAPVLGDSVRIADFPLPPPRKPDDAPRWLTTERLTSLANGNAQPAMKSDGSTPIPAYFRVPPDLYYGETQNLNLTLDYRYNALPLADGSALRVYLNGSLITEAALRPGPDFADRQRNVFVPVAEMRPFGNTFLFNFDFIPAHPGDIARSRAQSLQGAILPTSYLDIRGLDHWAAMPDLELFANAGFPFTRKADLAETTIIMPAQPSPKEIALLLYLMSHCGMQTGYPALRVEVSGPDTTMQDGHDYLLLGTPSDQPAFSSLETALPVTLDANGVHLKEHTDYFAGLKQAWQRFTGKTIGDSQPSNEAGVPDMMIEGIESPYFAGRSIVVLSLRNDDAVDEFADAFLERSQSSDIANTVSLLRQSRFTSYAVESPRYNVGYISNYSLLRIWLTRHFWILLGTVTLLSLVLAAWVRDYLAWLAASRLRVDEPA